MRQMWLSFICSNFKNNFCLILKKFNQLIKSRKCWIKKQQTWSSPSPLLWAKEFDSWEDVQSAGLLTIPFGLAGAADAAAGIGLLPLPRLPLLPYEGAGNSRRHSQFGSAFGEDGKISKEAWMQSNALRSKTGFWRSPSKTESEATQKRMSKVR